ncbi:MAG TPA: aspartate aminotransferase family protein [Kofleriaceae bacterium]|nr:aspartate aminotransferase family protein [Kofleriaceae bacterium]
MGAVRRTSPADVLRNDRKFLGRTEEPEALEIVAAEGSRVRDARGRTFIDFQMGWCVGNLGWNPPEIVARIQRFRGPYYVSPKAVYAPWTRLAEGLVDIAPGKLEYAYRCVGGSEAVELALQLAFTATGRSKIISLEGAYHGNTFGARSVGEGDLDAKLAGMKKLAPPLDADALERLETLLKHNDVAALIMEPISMNLNVLVPESDFMRELIPLCHRYGALVIFDEVACGFGRTGKLFAAEHWHAEPDIMCVAKALSSGIAPIASTLATADVADAAKGELSFYSTFGWMPLATEAALGTLAYWRTKGDSLLENIAERSTQLRHGLTEIFDDAELRIHGLAVAVGLDDKERAARITKRCKDHGLLLGEEEDFLLMWPALTVDEPTAAKALEIIETAARR